MVKTAKPRKESRHYDANYENFQTQLYAEIRREAFGEDIGQSSWITADEQDRYLGQLGLGPGKRLLDVACGAGGPAIRIAEKTGCSLVGVDIHEDAVSAAKALAAERGLAGRAEFRTANAAERLPFGDSEFDVVICIDAINHLPEREQVLSEWARVLEPGGRLLFTDPITVTGPLTKDEIAVRGSIGFFLFVPTGYDERVIADCGLKLIVREDVTQNMADLAQRRGSARASRAKFLREIEGDDSYEHQQQFFDVAACIAKERRLSRFLFIAEKSR